MGRRGRKILAECARPVSRRVEEGGRRGSVEKETYRILEVKAIRDEGDEPSRWCRKLADSSLEKGQFEGEKGERRDRVEEEMGEDKIKEGERGWRIRKQMKWGNPKEKRNARGKGEGKRG